MVDGWKMMINRNDTFILKEIRALSLPNTESILSVTTLTEHIIVILRSVL